MITEEVGSVAGGSSASRSSSRDKTFRELVQLKGSHATDSEQPSNDTVLELPSSSTEIQESLAITSELNGSGVSVLIHSYDYLWNLIEIVSCKPLT